MTTSHLVDWLDDTNPHVIELMLINTAVHGVCTMAHVDYTYLLMAQLQSSF